MSKAWRRKRAIVALHCRLAARLRQEMRLMWWHRMRMAGRSSRRRGGGYCGHLRIFFVVQQPVAICMRKRVAIGICGNRAIARITFAGGRRLAAAPL